MPSHKIAIIGGAGSVGATTAYAILLKGIASEILLVDVDEKRCEAQVLDLSDAAFVSCTKIRTGTFKEASQCSVVIITAGAKQRPNETRVQLISRNRVILTSVISEMKPFHPDTVLLIVSNPVDVLTYFAQKISDLPMGQVLGSGTYLDSERLRSTLSKELNIAETSVHAYVLGEHGDSQFIVWDSAHIGNTPILNFPQIHDLNRERVTEYVKNKAYRIIEAKGATYFGIGAVAASICEIILFDRREVCPISHYIPELNVCLSLPAIVGYKGVIQTLKPPLNEEEDEKLKKSAKYMREIIDYNKL